MDGYIKKNNKMAGPSRWVGGKRTSPSFLKGRSGNFDSARRWGGRRFRGTPAGPGEPPHRAGKPLPRISKKTWLRPRWGTTNRMIFPPPDDRADSSVLQGFFGGSCRRRAAWEFGIKKAPSTKVARSPTRGPISNSCGALIGAGPAAQGPTQKKANLAPAEKRKSVRGRVAPPPNVIAPDFPSPQRVGKRTELWPYLGKAPYVRGKNFAAKSGLGGTGKGGLSRFHGKIPWAPIVSTNFAAGGDWPPRLPTGPRGWLHSRTSQAGQVYLHWKRDGVEPSFTALTDFGTGPRR